MPKYVSRESLVQAMIHDLGLSGKDAQDAVTLVFNELTDCLADNGTADIAGFGKFVLFHRKERMGINPVTGERIVIEASEFPKFKPSATLKKRCNECRVEK
ncbi:HU family DNA-binding protein [Faecalibaculum rodentium]|jgi:DNA-binding protein HU-beta|uniref:Bacterial nucleoid DNA-binding protein n=2 Tax=Faecalibaculum rodentium TaxID=1702221 RepID=A0A140DUT2_9FIRM|nr:HU family DNA-binding protein [Faecalibaculum rodentium]AMK54409.1 bacterial nucleoid DNA-binding protein [Faecalibaculum rodentium]OLU45729.1 diphthine synthase [Faecalibaculum rodentium]